VLCWGRANYFSAFEAAKGGGEGVGGGEKVGGLYEECVEFVDHTSEQRGRGGGKGGFRGGGEKKGGSAYPSFKTSHSISCGKEKGRVWELIGKSGVLGKVIKEGD